jgi:hypothetical protein
MPGHNGFSVPWECYCTARRVAVQISHVSLLLLATNIIPTFKRLNTDFSLKKFKFNTGRFHVILVLEKNSLEQILPWYSLFYHYSTPPLWSPGCRSRGPEFDYWRYHIFWEVVGLERGPLSLVITTEELLERKSSDYSLESREYSRRDPSHWPRGTLHPQKLALTSTSCGSSVGIVRLQTQATEFSFFLPSLVTHRGRQ